MNDKVKFEAAPIAALAERIERKRAEVCDLREKSDAASREHNRATTELSNLQNELTRLVAPVLDHNTLHMQQSFTNRRPKAVGEGT